jgi:hypothetical protein
VKGGVALFYAAAVVNAIVNPGTSAATIAQVPPPTAAAVEAAAPTATTAPRPTAPPPSPTATGAQPVTVDKWALRVVESWPTGQQYNGRPALGKYWVIGVQVENRTTAHRNLSDAGVILRDGSGVAQTLAYSELNGVSALFGTYTIPADESRYLLLVYDVGKNARDFTLEVGGQRIPLPR